jgi:hypothetical protein
MRPINFQCYLYMDLYYSLWFMMIGSFIIQYFVMSIIMTNSISNITFSLGKFYISVIMALLMGLLEICMYDYHMYQMNSAISAPYYLALLFSLFIFLYLYQNQIYIDDEDYLREMIEHHSMALLTSEEILQKTQSDRVKKLAENIVSTQNAEINYMKQML